MDLHQVTATSIQFLKKADTSFLALWYFKLLLKCAVCTQNLWFFRECSRNNVFPKYMKLKTNNKSNAAIKATTYGKEKWVKEEMKLQYSKRDIFNIYVKVIHSQLSHRLHPIEFDTLDFDVRDKINSIIHKKYLVQKRKLNSLLTNQVLPKISRTKFSDHKFFQRFVNLSNVVFSDNECQLLQKGFKHNIQPTSALDNFNILGIESEINLKYFPNNSNLKHKASDIIKKEFVNFNKSSFELPVAKSIQQKSKLNNLIFTKADKGNTVIALTKDDYVLKTKNFIESSNFEILKKDPTNKFQKEIKSAVENSKSIINDRDKYKLTLSNPQHPELYSLIKLHKNGYPIRPVVSFFTAPSFNVSKFLIDIISKFCSFKPQFSIKNSTELINKIQDISLPHNSKFISFDVTNLFTSIPPKETITLVDNLLTSNNVNPVIHADILTLLRVCMNQNYFHFNEEIYSCKDGLIMGNPLSPLLAEIFMDNLEKIIHKHPMSNKFIYWYRYVDDIIANFTGTTRQLDSFLTFINSVHSNIKFTIEMEQNNSINFLDLTISKINNKHDFSIFHKPSHTDITIHNSSVHPYSHKLAAFNSMIHRLLTIPLSIDNYNKELNIIKQIAVNNSYDPKLIDDIIAKKLHKQSLEQVFPSSKNKNNNFNSLTYFGKPSIKIKTFLETLDLNICFKTDNNLGRFIKNNKSKPSKLNQSGVYKLKCGSNCDKIYIGRTFRNFKTRISEHKRSYDYKKLDSNYSNHLITQNHSFDPDFEILHVENKRQKLNLLEALEINKNKNSGNLLNDQLDINCSPLLNLFN